MIRLAPLVLCLPLVAGAQVTDPTLPPASVLEAAKSGQGNDVAPTAPSQRLQSILISPKRRVAVIDGKPVREGGRHQGFLLTTVSETFVVLQKDGSKEVLRLYPQSDSAPGRVTKR